MMSVGEGADAVRARLTAWDGRLSVAAVNGTASTVVSGDPDALDELLAQLREEKVRAKRLPVDYASHSAHVETLRERLADVLDGIAPRATQVPFYSTVTGGPLDTTELDAGYWYTNLRGTVLFEQAVRAAVADGHHLFIESSPHPVLTVGIQETDDAVAAVGSLRRDEGGRDRMLTALGEAFTHGAAVDWTAVAEGRRPRRVPPARLRLPARVVLARQHRDRRRRHLRRSRPHRPRPARRRDGAGRQRGRRPHRPALPGHPALARRPPGRRPAALPRHRAPGTRAARRRPGQLRRHRRTHPCTHRLVLPEHGAVQLQVTVGPPEGATRPVTVWSRPESPDEDLPWTRHADGLLAPTAPSRRPPRPAHRVAPQGAEPVPLDGLYDELAALGLGYGPLFQGLRAAWRTADGLYARRSPPTPRRTASPCTRRCRTPPCTPSASPTPPPTSALLPFAWSGVRLYATGATALRVRVRPTGEGTVSLTLADPAGAPVATVDSLTLRPPADRGPGRRGPPRPARAPCTGSTGCRPCRWRRPATASAVEVVRAPAG
ncbi:acyltransferase domain-containing protein [Streptomyces tricolor]|nr:acyltransferase domain-containing protein [Streptomyces tricolor]